MPDLHADRVRVVVCCWAAVAGCQNALETAEAFYVFEHSEFIKWRRFQVHFVSTGGEVFGSFLPAQKGTFK